MREQGISVVVCCYNSAERIRATPKHLFVQKTNARLSWEVIVVDNNSTDNTRNVAEKCHAESGSAIPFEIVDEPRPGLSNAREKGFAVAKFNIVLMVDDDNLLTDTYLNGVWDGFNADDGIGMIGGKGIPVLEKDAPAWFGQYAYCYATGDQGNSADETEADMLYGAGLALRMDILDKLKKAGFRSILSDRTGTNLMSGGDTELCLAFRMAGYRLVHDPKLTFKHHLPSSRITWKYLRKLFLGFGMTKAGLDMYTTALADRPMPEDTRFPFWFNRASYLLITCLKKDTSLLLLSLFFNLEGNRELLPALARWGHIKAIIGMRKNYLKCYSNVYGLKRKMKVGE
ncbi:MAG: glycosyltransferase family 2 protein [Flavobacteriales bacterium]|nr:glycosyltransferase family 2 protein [Flavobacteriales bacterium]